MESDQQPVQNGQIYYLVGAHLDILGKLKQDAVHGASNPGNFETLVGGISFNMAAASAQLGVGSILISPVGDDSGAVAVQTALEEFGISDCTFVKTNSATASYTSIVQPDGDLVIALADMDVYEQLSLKELSHIADVNLCNRDWIFVNSNLKSDILKALTNIFCNLGSNRPLISASTVSHSKAPRLRDILSEVDCLFTNRTEAENLLGVENSKPGCDELIARFRQNGCKSGTISNGAEPLYWWHGDRQGIIKPIPPQEMVNVIGGGDALAGAVLAGLSMGNPFEQAVRNGMAAATLTLSTPEPVHRDLSWNKLNEIVEEASREH